MKVLIVEDEPFAQNELKRLLEKTRFSVDVLECTDSVEDTVEWLKNNAAPDLIFLDIQLSDGLSFEIFKQIKVSAPIIFTTAFDEYAIRAFKLNSIDYLLKPIKQDDLEQALDKLETLKKHYEKGGTGLDSETIEKLLNFKKPEYKSRFIAKIGDQIKYIDIKDVAYFYAEDNEVFLITRTKNRYIIEFKLDQLEKLLDPLQYYRINRSYIVYIGSIMKINKYFNSRLHLELSPETNEEVLISRVKVPEFLKWMDK